MTPAKEEAIKEEEERELEKENKKEKIYRYFYDNPKDPKGKDKPNELLGEFEIINGDTTGYDFEAVGMKDGKKYKIFGQEVSALADYYNAGTKCFVEEII